MNIININGKFSLILNCSKNIYLHLKLKVSFSYFFLFVFLLAILSANRVECSYSNLNFNENIKLKPTHEFIISNDDTSSIKKEIIQIKYVDENNFKFTNKFEEREILQPQNKYNSGSFRYLFLENIKIDLKIFIHDNIIDLSDAGIPSDIIEFLPKGEVFELLINQGKLPENVRNKLLIKERIENTNNNFFDFLVKEKSVIKHGEYFIDDYTFTDMPSGILLFLGSNQFMTYNPKTRLKLFFDIFSYIFKVTYNPIFDKTNYVNFYDYYLMSENTEKACTDHLDGIKNILPYKLKKHFENLVDYKTFANSDFKSIKIFIKNDDRNNSVNFSLKILYKNDNFNDSNNKIEFQSSDPSSSMDKFDKIELQPKYTLLRVIDEKQAFEYEFLKNLNIENNRELLNNSIISSSINNISSRRFLIGNIRSFDNFKLNNIIKVFSNSKNIFRIIDLIPDTLDVLFSSIKIDMNIKLYSMEDNNINPHSNLKEFMKINLKLSSLEREFKYFLKFFFTEQIETQNPRVPFTYENKKSMQLNFVLAENFFENYILHLKNLNDENYQVLQKYINSIFLYELDMHISYELKKKILNFESIENENELGYKIPCGLVLLENKKTNMYFLMRLNNHIYYNFPDIDGTMPFNIIALSWVVYGFIFIQTLNLFLLKKGEEEKSLFQAIKERFMAKWGFLFGK